MLFMKWCGKMWSSQTGHKWQYRLQTHTQDYVIRIVFHGKNGYTSVLCCTRIAWLVLITFERQIRWSRDRPLISSECWFFVVTPGSLVTRSCIAVFHFSSMSGSCCSELISIPIAAASAGSGSSRPCLIKMLTKMYVDEHNMQWVT